MSALTTAWRRLNALDPLLVDGALAATLAIAAAVEYRHYPPPLSPFKLALEVASVLPLVGRRRYPFVCQLLQVGLAVGFLAPPTVPAFFSYLIGYYSVGAHSRYRVLPLVLMIAGQLALALAVPQSRPPLPDRIENTLLTGGLWLAGNAVRNRQARAEAMEERALRLERERELAGRIAIVDERARIARELHDVVAHSVSVMVVQAGAARRLLARRPERAGEALQSVEASGREALTELRHLLGLLTERTPDATLSPQPGLDQLDALVDRVTAAGLDVTLRVEGPPRPLPPGLDLTAYRVVQEALTNVLKHAAGARTEVIVRFLDGDLELEVVDAGGRPGDSAAGAGRGLIGMRERVVMYGGEVEARRRPEGGFAVRARLPLQAGPA